MTNFSQTIAASSDDAFESAASSVVTLTDSNITIQALNAYVGLRFLNVTIPQGATISSATLTLEITSTSFDDINVEISCEAIDDAVTFAAVNGNISGRTKTTNKTNWVQGSAGTGAEVSPSFATSVSDVISRAGWASGNDLVVLLRGLGTDALRFRAYDGSTTPYATIAITYATANTKSVGGTLTSAGAIVRSTGKVTAGTLTSSGAATKRAAKSPAGALTSAGVLTRRAGKTVAGTLTSAGAISRATSKASHGSSITHVSASADDADEEDTSVSIANPAVTAQAGFTTGAIFRSVPIPPGVTVLSAALSVVIYEPNPQDFPNLTIRGEINPAAFSQAIESDITDRTKTSAGVVWEDTGIDPGAGVYASSPDISTVIQEIIDGDWAVGDDIGLYLIDNGQGGVIIFYAYDSGPNTYPPRLTIEWIGPGHLAGFLSSAGTVAKQTAKTFAGVLTSSGALAIARAFLIALGGTLTSAGALTRQTGKAVAGALTSGGDLTRQTAKNVAGTLTSSGALTMIRTFLIALGGTLTSAGAVVRSTSKGLAGTLTSDGGVVKMTARAFAGTLTSAGALSRQAGKAVGGALTSAGALVRSTSKNVAGSLTSAGGLVKTASKNVAGTLTSDGGLVKTANKALAGALTSAGTLAKETGKAIGGTLTSAGAVVKSTSKNVAGALVSAGAVVRATAKNVAGALTSSGSLATAIEAIATGLVELTARARSFALTANPRDFALSARVRAFGLTAEARDFALTVRERLFRLTAKRGR